MPFEPPEHQLIWWERILKEHWSGYSATSIKNELRQIASIRRYLLEHPPTWENANQRLRLRGYIRFHKWNIQWLEEAKGTIGSTDPAVLASLLTRAGVAATSALVFYSVLHRRPYETWDEILNYLQALDDWADQDTLFLTYWYGEPKIFTDHAGDGIPPYIDPNKGYRDAPALILSIPAGKSERAAASWFSTWFEGPLKRFLTIIFQDHLDPQWPPQSYYISLWLAMPEWWQPVLIYYHHSRQPEPWTIHSGYSEYTIPSTTRQRSYSGWAANLITLDLQRELHHDFVLRGEHLLGQGPLCNPHFGTEPHLPAFSTLAMGIVAREYTPVTWRLGTLGLHNYGPDLILPKLVAPPPQPQQRPPGVKLPKQFLTFPTKPKPPKP